MRTVKLAIVALGAAAAFGLQACAYDDYGLGYDAPGYPAPAPPYGDYAYQGQDFGGPPPDPASRLDPWLAQTGEGHRIVALGFGADADAPLDPAIVDRINIWFRRYADTDHDLRLTDDEIRMALVQASRPPADYAGGD